MFARFCRSFAVFTVLAISVVALASGPALAASSATLNVTFPSGTITYGTPYVVSGCGYASTGVTVVVHSPEAVSFAGQMPDANGCISISNFSTQGSGHYDVDAFQELHGARATRVASTSFDLT
jgi:hypothetical protein